MEACGIGGGVSIEPAGDISGGISSGNWTAYHVLCWQKRCTPILEQGCL